jgi:hypothetical protein
MEFSNGKVIYFYPNDTRNDLSGSPYWHDSEYIGSTPGYF